MYYVYILTSFNNGVLYVGVTNDLIRRVYEHKNHLMDGFTKDYDVTKLVYYESVENVNSAIAREKSIKNMLREKKIALIYKFNPEWEDLYNNLID